MPDWLDSTFVQAAAAVVQAVFALVLIWFTRTTVRETRLIAKETQAMARSTERMVAVSQDQYRAALRPAVVVLLRREPHGMSSARGFRVAARNEGPGPALDFSYVLVGAPFRYKVWSHGASGILRGGGEEELIDFALDEEEPFSDPVRAAELKAARAALQTETDGLNRGMTQAAIAAGGEPAEGGGTVYRPPPRFDKPREEIGRRHEEIKARPSRLASERPGPGVFRARYRDVYGREWMSEAALEYERPAAEEAPKQGWPAVGLGPTVIALQEGSPPVAP